MVLLISVGSARPKKIVICLFQRGVRVGFRVTTVFAKNHMLGGTCREQSNRGLPEMIQIINQLTINSPDLNMSIAIVIVFIAKIFKSN